MNVCAVRSILEGYAADSARRMLKERPLPHEPKSEHLYAIRQVHQLHTPPGRELGNFIGDYAECKHCNCIYAVTED